MPARGSPPFSPNVRLALKAASGSAPQASPRASGASHLAELVRASSSVVALTGAGISVPSGIPDFRTPGSGLWEKVDPMEVAHIDAFRRDPIRFWGFYSERFATLGEKVLHVVRRFLSERNRHQATFFSSTACFFL